MERFESVSLRESILSTSNAPYVPLPFDVVEWNLTKDNASIRTMSGIDRYVWEQEREKDSPIAYAVFLTLILGDEHGNKLFSVNDAEKLANKDWRIIDRLITEGFKQNELTKKDDIEQSKK